MITEHLFSPQVKQSAPEELCLSIVKSNDEINSNIESIESQSSIDFRALGLNQNFRSNINFVLTQLGKHLEKSLNLATKDMFITIYMVQDFEKGFHLADADRIDEIPSGFTKNSIKCIGHYPSMGKYAPSDCLNFNSPTTKRYECYKIYASHMKMGVVYDTKNYFSKRSKSIKKVKHLYCIYFHIEEKIVGLLNIELHNKKVFEDEDQMTEFLTYNIRSFSGLIEYQFLRKRLLTIIGGGVRNDDF